MKEFAPAWPVRLRFHAGRWHVACRYAGERGEFFYLPLALPGESDAWQLEQEQQRLTWDRLRERHEQLVASTQALIEQTYGSPP